MNIKTFKKLRNQLRIAEQKGFKKGYREGVVDSSNVVESFEETLNCYTNKELYLNILPAVNRLIDDGI